MEQYRAMVAQIEMIDWFYEELQKVGEEGEDEE